MKQFLSSQSSFTLHELDDFISEYSSERNEQANKQTNNQKKKQKPGTDTEKSPKLIMMKPTRFYIATIVRVHHN